jgi:hypothetical protein
MKEHFGIHVCVLPNLTRSATICQGFDAHASYEFAFHQEKGPSELFLHQQLTMTLVIENFSYCGTSLPESSDTDYQMLPSLAKVLEYSSD